MLPRLTVYQTAQEVFQRLRIQIGQACNHCLEHVLNVRLFYLRSYTRLVGSYGLQQEFITPNCPQQNGSVERVIGILPPSKRGDCCGDFGEISIILATHICRCTRN